MKTLLALLAAASSLHAELLVVPVVGKGWHITFEGPLLHKQSIEPTNDGVVLKANAGAFNLSAFVEAPAGDGKDHVSCRDHIWAQAGKNPMIQKETVKKWRADKCECVEYTIAGDFQGEKFTQANINCFFVHEGRWVDVHASVISPQESDLHMLQKLAKSLSYGPFPAKRSEPSKFTLPGLGLVSVQLPSGWLEGNATLARQEGRPDVHTLTFFSPSDPNKNWKLSFFTVGKKYQTLEDIQLTAREAQESIASGSLEGRANLREIKLKKGVGCQAVYRDASLAGKPVEIGNVKVISSGFIAPLPDVLGSITIFADDTEDSDFKAAIKALETIEFVPATGA